MFVFSKIQITSCFCQPENAKKPTWLEICNRFVVSSKWHNFGVGLSYLMRQNCSTRRIFRQWTDVVSTYFG